MVMNKHMMQITAEFANVALHHLQGYKGHVANK